MAANGISRRGLAALAMAGAPLAARAQGVTDRVFDSAGVPIRFTEQGQGQPIILVHGYTSTLERQFGQTGVTAGLAARYRVIAMDARGHGRSGKPYAGRISWAIPWARISSPNWPPSRRNGSSR
jgi:pimeloyl-ACP methyl ester carboxylesterase